MTVTLRTSRVTTARPVGLRSATTNYNGLLRSTGPDQTWRACLLEYSYAWTRGLEQPPSRQSSNIRHLQFHTICQDSLFYARF